MVTIELTPNQQHIDAAARKARQNDMVRQASLASLEASHRAKQSRGLTCADVVENKALRALVFFAITLLFGGAIFSALEHDRETSHRAALGDFLRRMHDALTPEQFHELIGYLDQSDRVAEELIRARLPNKTGDPLPAALAPHDWDFVGACFFCFTAATTIGYGNYTPKTDGGKMFLVFYALIAIPSCLNAFAHITDRALALLARRFRKRQVFDKRIREVGGGSLPPPVTSPPRLPSATWADEC